MPKSLIFVLVVFIWETGKALDSLVRYPIKVEYYAWESLGMPFLHFLLTSVSGALFGAVVICLLKRSRIGFSLSFLAVIWGAMYGATVTAMAIRDRENVRELYMLGREVRGFSVPPEAADAMFTPSGMWGSYFVAFALFVLAIVILSRQRSWFKGKRADAGTG